MAAFFSFSSGKTVEWHVGEKVPVLPHECMMIQMDGDELGSILAKFSGLPVALKKRLMVWRMPWSQFIYDNLL